MSKLTNFIKCIFEFIKNAGLLIIALLAMSGEILFNAVSADWSDDNE